MRRVDHAAAFASGSALVGDTSGGESWTDDRLSGREGEAARGGSPVERHQAPGRLSLAANWVVQEGVLTSAEAAGVRYRPRLAASSCGVPLPDGILRLHTAIGNDRCSLRSWKAPRDRGAIESGRSATGGEALLRGAFWLGRRQRRGEVRVATALGKDRGKSTSRASCPARVEIGG